MSNQIEITTKYDGDSWLVTSVVKAELEFPTDVYLWTLDSKGALAEFQAIGNIDQVTRYPLFDSDRTSNFGIHLVRYSSSTQRIQEEEEAYKARHVLKQAFQILLDGYSAAIEPVTELYPGGGDEELEGEV